MIDEQSVLEMFTPLIKIIHDRESIYFEALSFTNKNIESTSSDFDQLDIFGKFLKNAADADASLVAREMHLLSQVSPNEDPPREGCRISSSSKQMMRLSARVLEIMDSSVERARKSLFSENGRLSIDFSRFKKSLHKIIKQDEIDLADFGALVISFTKNKYRKQISKLKTYLNRLAKGEFISLRDIYNKEENSENSSPDEHTDKSKSPIKAAKRLQKSPQNSDIDSPLKKSVKKPVQTKTKRTLNLKNMKQEDSSPEKSTREPKNQKQANATKLLKLYAMMELSKKEFLEDYVFQKNAEEQQRKRLMTTLMEKNKLNGEQIDGYKKKCANFNLNSILPNPSSDENPSSYHRNESSVGSKLSLRTSFVISKRKPSFTFESPSERSDAEHITTRELPLSKTIKNFSARKRVSDNNATSRPKPRNQSKKIFVVKSPMVFEEEMIPKAEVTHTSWVQAPLTGKDRSRKNEHIRLKKRNNPVPLDSSFLPDFQFTQYKA